MGIFRGDGGTGDSNTDATVTAVTEQATIATTKASEAADSATAAGTSATNAASSASASSVSSAASSTYAGEAASSATSAATSATASAASATAAATAETNAETAETNAETAETNAAASATTATTKAAEAATSATSASTSASTATTKASEAATSASNAATSETNAGTSASTATTKASEASTSASNAATSEANAAASYDDFDDRYLGAKSSAPTTDNDGDALVTGALYFNTSSNSMKVWSGSAWLDAYASLSGALIATNNLSDLNNAGTARTNLGLGTAATTASTDYATAAQGTKVDGIEAGADVTDTTNVTAAGALMDSEVTNLAQVKAFDSADYATAAQGTTADNALPKSGGAMTGAITTNSTFDGRDVATDGTKLDGIEVGATADQTAAEIKIAYESNADTNAFTDADHTKLDGIEASADVTDTANVTAAGALMDSELTSIASVKALNQGVATTDSPAFAGVTLTSALNITPTSGYANIELGGVDGAFIDLKAPSSDDYDMRLITSGGNGGTIDVGSTGDLSFNAGGSERARLLATGQVGIGTSSPAKLLDISSNSAPTIRLSNTRNDSNWTADPVFGALEFYCADVSGSGASVRASVKAEAATSHGHATELVFRNGDANGVQQENLRIDYFGNVGIGTTSPQLPLHVKGDFPTAVIERNAGANGAAGLVFTNSTTNGTYISGSDTTFTVGNVTDYEGSPSYAERMRIDSSGNVGIGTSSPSTKLDVDGQGCFKKNYSFASTNYHIKLKSAYGNGISSYIGNVSSSDRMNISAGGYYYGSSFYQLTDGATGMGAINIGEDGTLTYQSTTGATANSTVNPAERMRIDSSGTLTVTGNVDCNYLRADRIYSNNDGSTGYFFNDSGTRTAYGDGDFYIQSSVSNCYLYATNTYLGAGSGDVIHTRGNQVGGNGFQFSPNGDFYVNARYGSNQLAYGVRAWGRFEMIGTHSFLDDEGFSSVTDIGTGRSRLNFTNTMPNTYYSVNVTTGSTSYTAGVCSASVYSLSSTQFYVSVEDLDGGFTDRDQMNVMVVR